MTAPTLTDELVEALETAAYHLVSKEFGYRTAVEMSKTSWRWPDDVGLVHPTTEKVLAALRKYNAAKAEDTKL